MLTLGIALIIASAYCASSFLAILGVAITFWGAILLYIAPSRHVPLTLLNAIVDANSGNNERVLSQQNLTEKGVYLPPKNLQNIKSSLIFIPETLKTPVPHREETTEKLLNNYKNGVFLTPPGLSLSLLFEQELGTPFTETDLNQLENILPKLLIEDMEIAENVELQIQNNIVTINITGSILNTVCQQTQNQPRTHEQVGCLLTSAIACILAKATGKPITIQKEAQDPEAKTTRIEYQIMEE
jgi:hypothetical protein